MSEDAYHSIREQAIAEIKVKGSRFIGKAVPVRSEAKAAEVLAAERNATRDATHHCTAYRLGPTGSVYRFNDDGEPSGTAGRPILRQIDARELTNVLVIVTRYYGGTNLGTGGLVRAYGEAADRALAAAVVVTHVIFRRATVSYNYDDTSLAMQTIEQFDARIVSSEYTDRTRHVLDVPRRRFDAFVNAIVDALGGRCEVDF